MIAVSYAAVSASPSGARPLPLPVRRPFGGRLLTSRGSSRERGRRRQAPETAECICRVAPSVDLRLRCPAPSLQP